MFNWVIFVFSSIFIVLIVVILNFIKKTELKNIQHQTNYQYDKIAFFNSLKEVKNDTTQTIKDFQNFIDQKINFYISNQSEKLMMFHQVQEKLVKKTEDKLEEIRQNVSDKLQNSLNSNLGKSFEIIENQFYSLQQGLSDVKNLSKDVNALKRTLNHVKICGSFSEMQLSMLLQQILSPDQYACNVITNPNTNFVVEFAIKLPGLKDGNMIWLPIDVKFPKETYEKIQIAYEMGDRKKLEFAKKNMESVLKTMSKSINEKYIAPPYTTDFAILFLPFEGIYAEIIKNSHLLEELQRKYKIVLAGPSTLAAMLNSLQIGFRTLAIQKKSSEVWKMLEIVKQEFNKFGFLLNQAKKKLESASSDIEKVMVVRKNLVEKKLKNLENSS
ncbi:DNA recombination protein RmuC [Blattabacterium cuenoti]|uniref:DNA recombination protein RmuC n=1 Tax=Blattabacterium cuenoti TaxID=1653831 RepID=UPI00163BC255|nr:DNA recombination protein RmuC [Blattabacterium cuenoti]